jgi:hypothetical protein
MRFENPAPTRKIGHVEALPNLHEIPRIGEHSDVL